MMGNNWYLHRVKKGKSDWEHVAPAKRSNWQRVAASTHGIVTPGNIVSFGGFTLVCIGLYNIYFGELVWGLLYIGLGRLADIADGYVAHATGTKSQIGEAVDATIDKLTILMSLVVFLATGILPLVAVAIIGLRNSINISLSVAARLQKQILHPSLAGKFAAATEWATVLLFILAAIANEQTWESLEMIMLTAAWAMLGVSLFIGVTAIKDYAQDVFKKI